MFYLLFFFSCMIPGGSRAARLVFLAVTSTLLMWLSADYYVTDLYYKSGICFVLGTLVAMAGDRLRTIPDRYIALLLLPLSAALILSYREAFGITDMVLSSVTSCMSCIVLILALKLDFRRWWFVPLAMIVVGALLTTTIDPTPTFNDSGAFMLLFDGICVVLCRISLLEEPLAFLGAMSLELYLIHYHTFWYVDTFVDGTVPTILCSAILSLILSYIAYRLCRAVMDFYNDGLVRMSAERT